MQYHVDKSFQPIVQQAPLVTAAVYFKSIHIVQWVYRGMKIDHNFMAFEFLLTWVAILDTWDLIFGVTTQ